MDQATELAVRALLEKAAEVYWASHWKTTGIPDWDLFCGMADTASRVVLERMRSQ